MSERSNSSRRLSQASVDRGEKPRRVNSRASSQGSVPGGLDLSDFKGPFSFDEFFNSLVGDILHPLESDVDSSEVASTGSGQGGGGSEARLGRAGPALSEVDQLLPLISDARKELTTLKWQIDKRLLELQDESSKEEVAHRKSTLGLEKGMEGLLDSFRRLDGRVAGVGQTAARIGDHLQAADAQRDAALRTMELMKYLSEFNATPGDLNELSPLFTDEMRTAEAAAVAQKLRALVEEELPSGGTGPLPKGGGTGKQGLSVALGNLQDYCNELENRLLQRFDAAAQRRELGTMSECARILSQFSRGNSAIQRFIFTRPMFLNKKEVSESDLRTALGERASTGGVPTGTPRAASRGLSILYKDIVETVRKEAATVKAVFPNPDAVVAMLVSRVMEDRVGDVIQGLLPHLQLSNPPALEEGGILQYLRTFAAVYERTMELAKELNTIGCGDLDVEGLADSLFSTQREEYAEMEQASLRQLFQAKMHELRSGEAAAGSGRGSRIPGASPTSGTAHAQPPMTVGVVTDLVRWNEEAIARCILLEPQPGQLATHANLVFNCLLSQVGEYTTDGLERAQAALNDATALRDRFSIGATVSKRVAAAAAAAAEAAAAAGESSVRGFMVAVQRATTNAAMVQKHFVSAIARLLTPVDGAYASCVEQMAASMGPAEAAAIRGLRQCLDTIMAEVDRLLAAEQKPTDYRPAEDGTPPDHRPTPACVKVIAYLSRVVEYAASALEGPNKQALLAELGHKLHQMLRTHMQRFTFNASGGLRLKRDVSEYADFVRSFKAPVVDEAFEAMGTLANVFIVAPESLPTLVEGSLKTTQKEALLYIQLREDYKTAKIASRFAQA